MQAEAPQSHAGESSLPTRTWHARSYLLEGFSVLELHGEIDIAALAEAEPQVDALTSAPAPRLVVDLTPADFFDCSGLRLLCRAYRRVAEREGTLRLVCGPGRALRVLRAAELTRVFRPVGTLEEALADSPAVGADLRAARAAGIPRPQSGPATAGPTAAGPTTPGPATAAGGPSSDAGGAGA
ncbi:STAS domain-containing protein [Streptomyces polyrhachis]|uniref:Anti-sigma factor antagonist n=1 Tax=Streptomyces polyrhachis TaxID=1282885 RepID=A0ABW2GKX6_9ACTN